VRGVIKWRGKTSTSKAAGHFSIWNIAPATMASRPFTSEQGYPAGGKPPGTRGDVRDGIGTQVLRRILTLREATRPPCTTVSLNRDDVGAYLNLKTCIAQNNGKLSRQQLMAITGFGWEAPEPIVSRHSTFDILISRMFQSTEGSSSTTATAEP